MAKSTKTKKKTKKKTNLKTIFVIIAAFVLLVSIIAVASKAKNNNLPLPINKDIAYGIDVSSHNGKIDWKKVKNEVDFAFIRVGYRGYANGSVNLDKRAEYNLKKANKYGVPVGVYFYSQAINNKEAEEEAKFLIKHIQHYSISLPVVIDFEYAYAKGKMIGRLADANLNKKEITSVINAFCKKVKKAGYIPAVYASTYIYESKINVKSLDKNIMIWVADYNKKITYDGDYDFWQFSKKGKCSGISSKYVDTNYWYIKKD